MEIEFSEYINVASFAQAMSLTPELIEPFELKWKGKKVEIDFKQGLRDSTTYIVTIDKTLKDLHNVALSRPIILAFSTGSQIDKGRLAGEIKNPRTGELNKKMDVLAFGFEEDGSLIEKALYRTQVGENGRFSFSYLPEREFRLLGLIDQNRSRSLDEGESAAHAEKASYMASVDSVHIPKAVLWEGSRDQTPARLSRVRAEDSKIFRLEFSETVQLSDSDFKSWTLRDSLSGKTMEIVDASRNYTLPSQILFSSKDSLKSTHFLGLVALRDSLGNRMDTLGVIVKPSAKKRTQASFEKLSSYGPSQVRDSVTVLLPSSLVALEYSSWLDPSSLEAKLDSNKIVGAVWKRSADGRMVFESDVRPEAGSVFEFSVAGDPFEVDTSYVAYFEYLSASDLGSISGYLADSSRVIIEFYNSEWGDEPLDRIELESGAYMSREIPKGNYRARIVTDLDGNSRWSSGSLDPFLAPERVVFLSDSLLVQSRFETVMDTLRNE